MESAMATGPPTAGQTNPMFVGKGPLYLADEMPVFVRHLRNHSLNSDPRQAC